MMDSILLSQAIFVVTLLITFYLAVIGRRIADRRKEDDLAGRSLNRWFVGLSAGATANSGFVVAGAVGLGYNFGLQWMMLPLAWLLGDLVFWKWFPERINAFGHKSGAVTLSEMLRYGLSGRWASTASILSAVVIVVGLAGYTAAQWIAGQKFLSGAFGFSTETSLAFFALFIVAYSSIGGFRGSVYADTFQAIVTLAGTILVLSTAIWVAADTWSTVRLNFETTKSEFFNPFPGATIASTIGFVGGWAAAAMGFGLGQPQVVSRYLASSSPAETRQAKWIYIGYVQFTWIAMTFFGVILRGVMPDLTDAEAGLSVFAQRYLFAAATGIVVANIFGFIASTANSLLVAMAQSIKHDMLEHVLPQLPSRNALGVLTLVAGLATMAVSFFVEGSVVSFVLKSISMIGAGLAVPIAIKIMGWTHSGFSLTWTILVGVLSAVIWSYLGLSQHVNEAVVGMSLGALTNWILAAFPRKDPA